MDKNRKPRSSAHTVNVSLAQATPQKTFGLSEKIDPANITQQVAPVNDKKTQANEPPAIECVNVSSAESALLPAEKTKKVKSMDSFEIQLQIERERIKSGEPATEAVRKSHFVVTPSLTEFEKLEQRCNEISFDQNKEITHKAETRICKTANVNKRWKVTSIQKLKSTEEESDDVEPAQYHVNGEANESLDLQIPARKLKHSDVIDIANETIMFDVPTQHKCDDLQSVSKGADAKAVGKLFLQQANRNLVNPDSTEEPSSSSALTHSPRCKRCGCIIY